jgi:uncharacterized protein (DUF488 family)
MGQPFFTIGHSTRTIAEFVELLQASEVRLVVDVRTIPRSRTNPQYNRDTLPASLSDFQIGYEHIAQLGGLRSKKSVDPQVNGFWQNKSFHNYADYALSEDFHAGLMRLMEIGSKTRCAIMCAEAVWWRCHRRIITDYLLASGEQVFHILGKGHVELARITPGAVPGPDGTVLYPSGEISEDTAPKVK